MKHAQVSFTNFVLILLIGLVVQFNQHFFVDCLVSTYYSFNSHWSSIYSKQGGVWQQVTNVGVDITFPSSSKTVIRFVQWHEYNVENLFIYSIF